LSSSDLWDIDHLHLLSRESGDLLIWAQNDGSLLWKVDADVSWSVVELLLVRLEPMVVSVIKSLVATESILISLVEHKMIRLIWCSDLIVLERLSWMEVENINKITFLVNNYLVSLMLGGDVLMRLAHRLEDDFHLVHHLIPGSKLSISKVFIIHQIPLSSAVLIAISVSFSWKIDPLRMSELISHEVKIALSTKRLGDQPDHLVKSHTSGDSK